MKSEFSTKRSTNERIVTAALIALGTLLLLGIQSLFLTHIWTALPQDNLWRIVTIACFLAPPFAFAFLVIFKMNFSRSQSQDFILYTGMSLELGLFVVNLIVAVNAKEISGTMLGTIGLLLGGVAGVVSAGTTAFALAADPMRGVAKAQIEHDLAMEKMKQEKARLLMEQALDSPEVLVRAQTDAQNYMSDQFRNLFAQRAGEQGNQGATRPISPGSNPAPHPEVAHEPSTNGHSPKA